MIPPIMLDDEAVEWMAESIYEIHRRTVNDAGFDLSDMVSDARRREILGVISSVLVPVFTEVFGQSPEHRYGDVFDQIGDFAEHLAKRHVFADGNKRTTMQVSLALLDMMGVVVDVPDSPEPSGNGMYRWVQDVVNGSRTKEELSLFLRSHSSVG